MDIDVSITEPTRVIWLHSVDLTVEAATVSIAGWTVDAQPIASAEFLGLALEAPVSAAKAILHITYSGQLDTRNSRGLFRGEAGGNYFVFTQFQATDARRAFPCFDEPRFKVPWRITLNTKKEHLAFANSCVALQTEDPDGLRTVQFAETEPLPTYLVAFAVGPFEVVDLGKHGKNSTPLRTITPIGYAVAAARAAEATPPIFEAFENYLGIPYPYQKLDFIAAPMLHGAMEHPGLFTYALPLMLCESEDQAVIDLRRYISITAHEVAHIWFGDFVTPAWWDDLWLSEGLASWIAAAILRELKPEWELETFDATARIRAMTADSLVTTHQIRHPVTCQHDVAHLFDAITYEKAAAVIHMFEQWIGPKVFRMAIRQYLTAHRHGNATTEDFLSALSAAASEDFTASAFSTFLHQPGVPQVSVELRPGPCEGPATLRLEQARYVPLGSKTPAPQAWRIPIDLVYATPAGIRHERVLIAHERVEVRLPEASRPEWVLLNDTGAGYYRAHYKGVLFEALLKLAPRLASSERLALIADVHALTKAGAVRAADELRLVTLFADDLSRHVISFLVRITAGLEQHVAATLHSNYRRFIMTTFGARAHALGWQPYRGEDANTRLLRGPLMSLVACFGEDQVLIKEAMHLAHKWLQDRCSIPSDVVTEVLNIAARFGDRTLYNQVYLAARLAKSEGELCEMLTALSSFRTEELVRANFKLFLSGEFDGRLAFRLLFGGRDDMQTRDLRFALVRKHYDDIATLLPSKLDLDLAGLLPRVAAGFSDEQHYAEVKTFFAGRVSRSRGGPRILAETLEQISQSMAFCRAQSASIAEFLQPY